jgi:DNA-binding NtrC family response regulator
LVESELFGHARGSFTGAAQDKQGIFEAAAGGTLFLDEISTLPLDLQSRLLRVLQEKTIRRVGETRERQVDGRVVAATNEDLRKLVKNGSFRADLYYRLNVLRLEVPPLRNRRSDVGELSSYFLSRLSSGSDKPVSLSTEAVKLLETYEFPGNVRELSNLLEGLFYTSRKPLITAQEVAERLRVELTADRKPIDQEIRSILDELVSGNGNFWRLVRDPFLRRDLSRPQVRWLIASGLSQCGGSYRRLVEYFGMDQSDYKRLLAFLSNHDCKVDFRPFRRRYGPLGKSPKSRRLGEERGREGGVTP